MRWAQPASTAGTVGGIALRQAAVTLTYATGRGHALIGRTLYLPEGCAADEEHRELAGVPEEVMFATKPQLAGSLIERTHSRGIRAAFVAGDEVYGGRELRRDIRLNKWPAWTPGRSSAGSPGTAGPRSACSPTSTSPRRRSAAPGRRRLRPGRRADPGHRPGVAAASCATPSSHRPGATGPTGCTGPPGDAATSTAPARHTSAGTPTPRQHHDHNELQLP